MGALVVVGTGLATMPSQAAGPSPVSSISVTPLINGQGHISVDVSWTGADPSADGVVVCLKRGLTTPATPSNCESRVVVAAPRTSSGPIPIFPAKTYTVAVYDYVGTTPDPTYSTPVSEVRHGTSLTFHYVCNSYTVGSHCAISSVLKDVFKGAALAHRPVELWTSRPQKNSTWSQLARVTTDSTGHARTTITLDKSRLYQWRYVAARAHELTTYTAQYNLTPSS